MARLRTLIAYDDRLFLDRLALLLGEEFEIAVTTTDFSAVLELVRLNRPALLVMGLSTAPDVGLRLLGEIRDLVPDIAVAVIGRWTEEQVVSEAFRRGAAAYMLTASTPTELLEGVRAAVTHRGSVPPDLLEE